MTTQQKKQTPLIPDFPRDPTIVNVDRKLVPRWYQGLSSLYQQLQHLFSVNGVLFPPLSSDDIDAFEAKYTPFIGQALPSNLGDESGRAVFDTTNRVPKMFVITYNADATIATAAWKTFTLT